MNSSPPSSELRSKSKRSHPSIGSPDSSIEIIDDADRSIEETFLRLASEVERKHEADAAKRREFHTSREVQAVHGRFKLRNADPSLSREAETAAACFAKKNKLSHVDNAQPVSSGESGEKLPVKLRITHHCPVLNCGLGFTSLERFNKHLRRYRHSPCQPCINLPDGRLVCDQVAYLCPVCGQLYNTTAECLEHMNSNDHNVLMKPLRLGGYICCQCLQIFPSRKICNDHMAAFSHWSFTYPFVDDTERAEPLRVPVDFIVKFEEACSRVKWSMQCVTCHQDVEPRISETHIQKDHILCAETTDTAADVFMGFIKSYTCIMCLRLFDDAVVDSIHDCGGVSQIKGLIIENDCRSFQEYTRRLCLPLAQTDKVLDLTSDDEVDMQIVASGVQSQPVKRKQEETQELEKKRACVAELSRRASLLCLTDDVTTSQQSDSGTGTDSNLSLSPVGFTPSSSDGASAILNDGELRSVSSGSASGKDLQVPLSKSPQMSAFSNPSSSNVVSSKQSVAAIAPLVPSSSSVVQRVGPPRQGQQGSYVTPSEQSVQPSRPLVPSVVPSKQFVATGRAAPPNTCYSWQGVGTNRPAMPAPGPCHMARSNSPFGDLFDTVIKPVGYQTQSTAHTWLAQPRCDFSDAMSSGAYNFNAPPGAYPPPRRQRFHKPNPGQRTKGELPDRGKEPAHLHTMKHIIFLDLDNWPSFFKRLPESLPVGTFVWGFSGGGFVWDEPIWNQKFVSLKRRGGFFLHPQCGRTKDAADFALVMTVGRMDERLPKKIAFTILSGDTGFIEVERQMSVTERITVVLNPHHKREDILYAEIISVGNS